eukprot:7070379-Heterocapsa_arctica.AAC.1
MHECADGGVGSDGGEDAGEPEGCASQGDPGWRAGRGEQESAVCDCRIHRTVANGSSARVVLL